MSKRKSLDLRAIGRLLDSRSKGKWYKAYRLAQPYLKQIEKVDIKFYHNLMGKYNKAINKYKKRNNKNKKYYYGEGETFKEHIHKYFNLTYKRYKLLIKDGCCNCKSRKQVHLHHKIPKGIGGTNIESNFIVLCNVCHLAQHNRKSWDNQA